MNAILGLAVFLIAAAAPEPLSLGEFTVEPGLGGIVVAAPHEGFDLRSSEVASATARVLGAGYVSASGFRTFDRPINVNRPTEGVRMAPDAEVQTDRSRTVFLAYHARVGEAARGPVRLLIEIHGNARPENAGLVEIATVGIASDSALALKARLEPAFPGYRFLVEPLDELHYAAMASKRWGALSSVPVALHFELPAALRAPGVATDTGRRLGEVLLDWLGAATASVPVPEDPGGSASVPP